MNQVTLQGQKMSAQDAARIVMLEIESRGATRNDFFNHLGVVLEEWCEPETRFSVIDAVYLRNDNQRLN